MSSNQPFRIGYGYDVHAFANNRKLILGGIEIPYEKGLLGHSDADVLLHAISDALLGALALGDIGKFFPDTDLKFKDADSKVLLKEVYAMVRREGYIIGNIDAVLALQRPKIANYITNMRETIAAVLEIDSGQVSVKATTTEKLGFVGKEEGAAAYSAVLLMKENT